ncbi:MAG: hypothetical protein V1774_11915 [Candidatus Eisenbacteria bacterium]
MHERRGEKLGWIGGWCGGFLWAAILAIVRMAGAHWLQGIIGIVLVALAGGLILACAPWKHPATRYWKLMAPIYAALAACLVWSIWSWGGLQGAGLNAWSLGLLLPLLTPFWTAGGRRWSDQR